ncbi:MAG: PEPxxWA-CTERM sorting domain-containing protein [Thiobacillus sp.]|nr:PEPxxWA-CTERM sorting domain-containing protein [Thiobacillus sp.]
MRRDTHFILGLLLALAAPAAVQAASISSQVSADVDYLGDVTYQSDVRTSPGGTSVCAELPTIGPCGDQWVGGMLFIEQHAYAGANTDFGSNRARVLARSFGSDVVSTAQATSFWSDELTFTGVKFADVVTLRFHLDGNWNEASAAFQLGVFDPALPPPPPDDVSLFDTTGHPIDMGTSAMAGFDSLNMAGLAFSPISGAQPAFPTGTSEDGAINWAFELSFIPVDGRTYTLASVLALTASIADVEHFGIDPTPFGTSGSADFDSTAALTEIILPAGVSMVSAAGASYNVTVVPEPETWAMLLAGLGLVGFATRRRVG